MQTHKIMLAAPRTEDTTWLQSEWTKSLKIEMCNRRIQFHLKVIKVGKHIDIVKGLVLNMIIGSVYSWTWFTTPRLGTFCGGSHYYLLLLSHYYLIITIGIMYYWTFKEVLFSNLLTWFLLFCQTGGLCFAGNAGANARPDASWIVWLQWLHWSWTVVQSQCPPDVT